MGRCAGLSKCVLLAVNSAVFLIAAGALGVLSYLYSGHTGSHVVKSTQAKGLLVGTVVALLVALMGCRAALAKPSKRCVRCLYLLVLLCVAAAQAAGAAFFFNVGDVLQKAHDHGVDADLPQVEADAVRYLHDEFVELYKEGDCTGGGANGTALPIVFADVRCERKGVDDVFRKLLEASTLSSQESLARFRACGQLYSAPGAPSAATQAFCASEAHVVDVARRYVKYAVWLPASLAALTALLLLATTALLCRRGERRQDERLLREAHLISAV